MGYCYEMGKAVHQFKTKIGDKVIRTKKNGIKPKVDPKLLLKYSRGPGLQDAKRISNVHDRAKVLKKEKNIEWAEEQAARTEVLLTEDAGFIIPDEGEKTAKIPQREIASAADLISAAKHFELRLQFGPYRSDYTRNGQYLLLGGKGHVSAMNWVTKRLLCEMNVREEVADVQWLHTEAMFAIAQKDWVHIYDTKGVELHCLKGLYKVLRMAFLPYHFLLAASNENGWLSWLDVSVGEMVAQFNTNRGRLSVMEQNPHNAVICLGHDRGTVSMWSPNTNKPLARMHCHNCCIQAIAIDKTGKYMATSAVDRRLKIWDLRNLSGPIKHFPLVYRSEPSYLSFSQTGFLAVSSSNIVQFYKNWDLEGTVDPYLSHKTFTAVSDLSFCPYEDFCGASTAAGFVSILVPGSGEPNFDALEVNPLQTKSQRREAEVKALLEKIQPEMIVLDPTVICEVDVPTLQDKVEAKKQLLYLKPPKIDFTPRRKKRGNTARAARVKKIVQENRKKEFCRDLQEAKKELLSEAELNRDKPSAAVPRVLDRFRKKRQSKKTTESIPEVVV